MRRAGAWWNPAWSRPFEPHSARRTQAVNPASVLLFLRIIHAIDLSRDFSYNPVRAAADGEPFSAGSEFRLRTSIGEAI